ncbi:MAG TPA: chemotaxis protein CheW [Blastocatellia bacterium]|nr:chemotaxis protein CheW [Blastocatellia bacterium]
MTRSESLSQQSTEAAVAEVDGRAGPFVSVLIFEFGGERFAISVEGTEGVVDCPRLSPLPNAPEGLTGIGSVRGRITLAVSLNLEAASTSAKTRLILLKGEAQLGLLADHVEGVVALSSKQVLKPRPPESRKGKPSWWTASACFKHSGRVVPIVDVERLPQAL